MLKIHIDCFDSSECVQSAYVEQKTQREGVSGHSTWAELRAERPVDAPAPSPPDSS